MSQIKAIALVVVTGGVAEVYAPQHVDVRIIDTDNIHDGGDAPVELPQDVGYDKLCADAGLTQGVDFVYEGDAAAPCCHPRTEELFDRLDAEVFTGDEFFTPEARARFNWFIARWNRGLKEHAERATEPE